MTCLKTFSIDNLSVLVYGSENNLAVAAAQIVQDYLQQILQQKPTAAVVFATGNSQIQFLQALVALETIDWSRIRLFHLDEYLGIDANHPASFRHYLQERVGKWIEPAGFHYIQGDTREPLAECDRYGQLLKAQPLDLCFLGIGKNGHLAFNEPNVANWSDPYAIKLVKLDQQTRLTQVKQGHFLSLEAVPQYAFTLTLPTICSAQKLLCLASGKGKADAIAKLITGSITTTYPASILRQHPTATLLLDENSACLVQDFTSS